MLKQRAACKQVKRFAERVAPVAQTTHPAQAGLARVLNSLVVPPFLRRGNLVCLRGCSNAATATETILEAAERNMCPISSGVSALKLVSIFLLAFTDLRDKFNGIFANVLVNSIYELHKVCKNQPVYLGARQFRRSIMKSMKNTISKGTMTTMNTQFYFTNAFTNLFTRARLNNILRLATLAAACLALPTHALAQIIPCPEDVNGDGVVDSSDVSLVLLAIGDCPVSEPTISAVNPNTGATTGGTAITITGTNLTGASSVRVGSGYATSVVVVNDTTVTAVTPAGTAGAMNVYVTTAGGTTTLVGAFTYVTPWYTILEQAPNAAVVPDAAVRAKIVASGFPWRVSDNSSGIEMLLIPGGTFTMGCSPSNSYTCNSNENPTHQVTLSKAFYLGKTEVTQAQWQAKMSNNPSYFSGNANNPVEQVSWNDIAGFNTATGLRLPSEAEWEYACRGGTTTAFHSMPGYPNGTNDDSLLGNIAWYSSNNSPNGTKPVAGKVANAFGMYDMSGNVSEWCNDWYGSYAAGNATDPGGPSSDSLRVLRGGGWNNISLCRSSYRNIFNPANRSYGVGFRVARTPQ